MPSLRIPRLEQHGGSYYPVDHLHERIGRIFHRYEAFAGPDIQGDIHMALVGVNGAHKYLLSQSYEPLFKDGYHDFDVREGQIYGKHGASETNLGNWPPRELAQ